MTSSSLFFLSWYVSSWWSYLLCFQGEKGFHLGFRSMPFLGPFTCNNIHFCLFFIDFQGCVFWIASSMFAFQHLALTYDSAGLPQLGVLKLIAWKFFTNYLTSLLFLIFLQNNNEPCQTLSTHKLIHILLSQTQSSLWKNLNSWLCSHQDHDTSDYKLGFLTNLIIFYYIKDYIGLTNDLRTSIESAFK